MTTGDGNAERAAEAVRKRGGPKRKAPGPPAPRNRRGAASPADELLTLRVPKRIWKAWSGKSTTELHAMADRFGAPLRGETIDVAAAVLWYTRYVAEFNRRHKGGGRLPGADGRMPGVNGRLPGAADDGEGDPNMVGPLSPALEAYRNERAKIAKLTRLEMEKTLLSVAAAQQVLNLCADRLIKTQEELSRLFGDAAADIVARALADCDRMLRAGMGG
jgi:hypothetical protein